MLGNFRGRNLFGDLPGAPGASPYDFVIRGAEGAVWVTNRLDNTVSRVDLTTFVVSGTADVGEQPTAVVVGEPGLDIPLFLDRTEIDGQPVEQYSDVLAALGQDPGQSVAIVVERKAESAGETTRHTIEVPARKMRRLGLSMTIGPVTAVQAEAPAVRKIHPGDQLLEIDGQPIGDPLTLPRRLQAKAGTAGRGLWGACPA